jgi:hypothetical protein
MAVPVGYTSAGSPFGLWLSAGYLEEPTLIRIGYAIEQLLQSRVAPTLAGAPPPDPAPFDGCAPAAASPMSHASTMHMPHRGRDW